MAKAKRARKRVGGKSSRGPQGAVNALVDAIVELGEAAQGLKESWKHIAKAGKDGKRVVKPLERAGKAVVSRAKKLVGMGKKRKKKL
ncbi:hypothetical protein A2763_02240 [Candidatus Kaiserbacteria bacterium RIFCSPHIGHO2_01_FULL_54_36]|uniref:Uncharacterized protein n=1 Tax=Candidatus Kaiserbacteria bacterium RIFCSPHIGHO2_01_FULL_54_36 TaxID=1798482 RepID=A0A1F6CPD4_9BACT|nr:MAG: hypothetical protein A2763_02240 [Candidatus Kaiserbacteria bacterium RIFCSPHIGHO2_01_FULL_54_36]OGG75981.1 MAG: hypothetical protein A3A41_03345 [Candidatus Kaiserbacteria bacterium RIFCSPLOWO2_01_FULL_54_22]